MSGKKKKDDSNTLNTGLSFDQLLSAAAQTKPIEKQEGKRVTFKVIIRKKYDEEAAKSFNSGL